MEDQNQDKESSVKANCFALTMVIRELTPYFIGIIGLTSLLAVLTQPFSPDTKLNATTAILGTTISGMAGLAKQNNN